VDEVADFLSLEKGDAGFGIGSGAAHGSFLVFSEACRAAADSKSAIRQTGSLRYKNCRPFSGFSLSASAFGQHFGGVPRGLALQRRA
jgi:hypothetical protein